MLFVCASLPHKGVDNTDNARHCASQSDVTEAQSGVKYPTHDDTHHIIGTRKEPLEQHVVSHRAPTAKSTA